MDRDRPAVGLLERGHLGDRAAALVDGQLPRDQEERAWQHVLCCPGCRRLVEDQVAAKSLLGGLGYTVAMLALHVLSRGGLGMGDVKLAGGLGVYTGVLGPTAVLAAGVGAILLGGVAAGLLVLAGRATGRTALPFGPAMVAAAAGVLVLA